MTEATGTAEATGSTATDTTPDTTTESTGWREGLSPDIKDHTSLSEFKTPDDLAKSYVNQQKMIGVNKIPIPDSFGENEEVRGKFFNEVFDRLGRPKEAKDYKVPEGAKGEQRDIDAFKAEAHKLGILPYQFEGIYKYQMGIVDRVERQQAEGKVKKNQDSEASLRQELGLAYEGKILKAQTLLNKYGGDDYKALLDSGFGSDPAVVKFMIKMSDMMSEDGIVKGQSEVTMTPEQARKEVNTVTKQLLEMKQSDPEYKDLLSRKRVLYEMAYPSNKG